jgi:hypothetical protein
MVYSLKVGARNIIKEWANTSELVESWRFDLPNSIYLISKASPTDLSRNAREHIGLGRFIITEVTTNTNGWLPRETWQFFRNWRNK